MKNETKEVMNPIDKWWHKHQIYKIGYGIIIGLLLGELFRLFG